MKMKYKSSTDINSFSLDGDEGEFTCYGNIFNVVDEANEVTMPGCFGKSIQHFKELGTSPIFLFDHEPYNIIGKWIEFQEDETGLLLKGKFNLDTEDGLLRYKQVKHGDLQSFSIGYWYTQDGYEVKDGVTYLKELELQEISLVPFACNDRSLLIDIKSNEKDESLNPKVEESKLKHFKRSEIEAFAKQLLSRKTK